MVLQIIVYIDKRSIFPQNYENDKNRLIFWFLGFIMAGSEMQPPPKTFLTSPCPPSRNANSPQLPTRYKAKLFCFPFCNIFKIYKVPLGWRIGGYSCHVHVNENLLNWTVFQIAHKIIAAGSYLRKTLKSKQIEQII